MKTIALTSPTGNHLEITQVAQFGSNQEVYWKKWATSAKVEDEFTKAMTGSTHTGTLDAHLSADPDQTLTIADNAIEAGYKALLDMPELFEGWTPVTE